MRFDLFIEPCSVAFYGGECGAEQKRAAVRCLQHRPDFREQCIAKGAIGRLGQAFWHIQQALRAVVKWAVPAFGHGVVQAELFFKQREIFFDRQGRGGENPCAHVVGFALAREAFGDGKWCGIEPHRVGQRFNPADHLALAHDAVVAPLLEGFHQSVQSLSDLREGLCAHCCGLNGAAHLAEGFLQCVQCCPQRRVGGQLLRAPAPVVRTAGDAKILRGALECVFDVWPVERIAGMCDAFGQ